MTVFPYKIKERRGMDDDLNLRFPLCRAALLVFRRCVVIPTKEGSSSMPRRSSGFSAVRRHPDEGGIYWLFLHQAFRR
jgi:hypothetical protein